MKEVIYWQVNDDGTETEVRVVHDFGGFNPLSDDISTHNLIIPRKKEE